MAQADNPADVTSQFPPLMTKLQQAIGAHLILCCITCEDDVSKAVAYRIGEMTKASIQA
jgi:hypothetical protein